MNNIAFVISCEEYFDKSYTTLKGVGNDAQLIKYALEENCACIGTVEVINKENDIIPTAFNIINSILNPSFKLNESDIDYLYLYFSGHGFMNTDQEVFLVACDALKYGNTNLGFISLNDIIKLIKEKYKSNYIIVFLDMCLSYIPPKGNNKANVNYYPQGVAVFYSCFPNQESYIDPESSVSFFTKCLTEILNSEGTLTVSQISKCLKEKMQEVCEKNGITQNPYTSIEDTSLSDIQIVFPKNENPFSWYLIELSDNEKTAVIDFASKIDLSNREQILYYGSNSVQQIFNLQDYFREVLSQTMRCINESFDENGIIFLLKYITQAGNKSWFDFFINKPVINEEKIRSEFGNIVQTREEILDKMILHIGKLSPFIDKYSDYYKEIKLYIAAARIALNNNEGENSKLLSTRVETLNEKCDKLEKIIAALKAFQLDLDIYCEEYQSTFSHINTETLSFFSVEEIKKRLQRIKDKSSSLHSKKQNIHFSYKSMIEIDF